MYTLGVVLYLLIYRGDSGEEGVTFDSALSMCRTVSEAPLNALPPVAMFKIEYNDGNVRTTEVICPPLPEYKVEEKKKP